MKVTESNVVFCFSTTWFPIFFLNKETHNEVFLELFSNNLSNIKEDYTDLSGGVVTIVGGVDGNDRGRSGTNNCTI
jgi:hypothetical protein